MNNTTKIPLKKVGNVPLKVNKGEIAPDFNYHNNSFQRKLNLETPVEKAYFSLKRVFDQWVSLVLILMTWPLILFFMIMICLESKGSPIYSQVRVGKMGKLFKVYKLRSMYCNAERHGIQWAEKDDPRITQVGKFIRKTRIDELPQLINVFQGDMSFVGPRPERPEFVEIFSAEIQGFEKRCLVTPGITGLAQVCGGYELPPKDKLEFDMLYIKHGSLIMELYILLKTVGVVCSGNGAR